MSILSLNKGGKSVIIIPETTLNAGWCDIAHKIEKFIKCPKKQDKAGPPRLTDDNYPYAKVVRDNKWFPKESGESEVRREKGVIEISATQGVQELRIFNRCLVGGLEDGCKEGPTLSDIRRWSLIAWRNTFGVNIYELNNNRFLFEFPNRFMADQVVQQQWYWQKKKFNIRWWSPTEGCTLISRSPKETWIRAVGIPLTTVVA